jgi:hypothetical protein
LKTPLHKSPSERTGRDTSYDVYLWTAIVFASLQFLISARKFAFTSYVDTKSQARQTLF